MNFKVIISTLIILLLGSFIFLKKSSLTERDSNTLVIGTATAYAPFVSINPQGEYEGFDIDVANALTKQMGKKLVLKDLGSMTSLFTALNQGSIDAIIWGLSITQDRLKKVAMVHYQGEDTNSYPLIFWGKIPAGINSIADMKGKTVCVEPSSSQDSALNKYPEINKLYVEKVDDALLNIQYEKADAAFVEPAIAKKFQNKYPEIKILDIPLAKEDQVQGVGIVIKQDNAAQIKEIQDAVEALKKSGVISELEQKWGIAK